MSQETDQIGDTQAELNPYAIIAKKRDGKKLSATEIRWFIEGMTKGEIPDYQMSALLMAIYINNLDKEETAALTDAMLYSGRVLDFNDPTVIDKHSTGGVGDKTSFILAPIAASCGVRVPMIAGRGLGHTGGTVDKIESVSGFNTEINLDEFVERVRENHLVLIGQTEDIAPADKKIYALRDVTATIESIPLITASIMSKKLAEGASGLVMDIKVGSGAFMKTLADARKLAKSLSDTAARFDRNIITILTDMNQPLGCAVGNSLEIIECVECLKGNGPKDLMEVSLQLAGGMIYLAGEAKTHAAGIKRAKEVVNNGEALKKFREMIVNQGGNPAFVDDYTKLPMAEEITEVLSPASGYIHQIDGEQVGLHCVSLGGGRRQASDKIDFAVGLKVLKKVGDKVAEGEPLMTIHHHPDQKGLVKNIAENLRERDIKIKNTKPQKKPLIIESNTRWS